MGAVEGGGESPKAPRNEAHYIFLKKGNVRLIHRKPRTPKNSFLVFGEPRRGPPSPIGEGKQICPVGTPKLFTLTS